MKQKSYKIKSRIWITTEEGTFLGEGRIALLKEIEEHGSISKAAKAMKMSYKKAWELVNSMNKQGPELLVTPTIGGTGGGGSTLSDAGKKAIKIFTELNTGNRTYLDNQLKEIEFQK
ncbi:MAG: LysR family transcriptional regulator [Crocinitomicaceae bacterium]|nr:LysR family transcriptional regulator [Crocinitomicaceae bacterium]